MEGPPTTPDLQRVSLVLAGGGARGAYEAGVLAYLFESIYPRLRDAFEFDVLSGTSVGAIHAAYVAATASLDAASRTRPLLDTWGEMRVHDVLDVSFGDLLGVPMRALGMRGLARRIRGPSATEVLGGLVDIGPLERIVDRRIPWRQLRGNLRSGRPGVLCVSCTEIRSGRVTVFMNGPLANPAPWSHDPNAQAVTGRISARHVRASAAIPFLFPAVRIGNRFYVDGGLRMNTPLSPALRLRSNRVLVVALKHERPPSDEAPVYSEEVITQPAFLLGKVLDALMLDQLEYELARIGLVNAWIDRGTQSFGDAFLEKVNAAVREQRGVGYRKVVTVTIRPSADLGRIAADCYRREGGARALGLLPTLMARFALRGVPHDEADLLSYLFFDRCFTRKLIELGREDARRQEDEILEALGA